jgi:hypothetical protein
MQLFKLFILMLVVAAMTTSCTTKKHCKGLKAHPNYKKSW